MNFKIQKNKLLKNNFFQTLLIACLLLPFYFILYKIFSVRALSFGCFDDCVNYMAGHFMIHGKELYSEIFFNHIMGMAYLSYVVQIIHPPVNLYDFVLSHRQVILIIAFLLNVLIIKRFTWAGAGFVLFYEFTKFYIFGDRFLAESIVVYLAVYLSGLVMEKLSNKKLSVFDYVTAGVFSFLVMYLREPYIPLSLFLYAVLLWGKISKPKIISFGAFTLLIVLVVLNTSISDFIFNDYTVNAQTIIKSETNSKSLLGLGILQVFFNPIYVLIGGVWNIYRVFQMGISVGFICGMVNLIKLKRFKSVVIIIIMLGLSNIRIVEPGVMYYEAYHGVVWTGMLIFITLVLVYGIFKNYKKIGIALILIITMTFGYTVFAPASYIYDKIDLQEQLLTNFGREMNVGNVINKLSDKNDTVFLDGADDMIIWQSKLFTPYKYSWYTSVMPQIPLYKNARLKMFRNNPPDFYYDFCSKKAPLNSSLPTFIKGSYQQLYENGKKSCLYVLKEKIPEITEAQWKMAGEGFFTKP